MRAVIHIGAEKTGTTALQACFNSNWDTLAEAGIHYPRSLWGSQHWALALYALDDERTTVLGDRIPKFNADRAGWRSDVRGRMADELAGTSPDVLLLSSEVLSAQVVALGELKRLRELLDQWCDDYRVVYYLRRQDRATASLYSTDLRVGSTSQDIFGPNAYTPIGFDYDRVLDLWTSVFGVDALIPRIYDQLTSADLVDDFIQCSGLPLDSAVLHRPARANEALSAKAQQLMLEYNTVVGGPSAEPSSLRIRRTLAHQAARLFPGPPRRPSRAEARAYLGRFAEGNRRVAATWFAEAELFDDAFDEYPEEADAIPELEPRELVQLTARVTERLLAEQGGGRSNRQPAGDKDGVGVRGNNGPDGDSGETSGSGAAAESGAGDPGSPSRGALRSWWRRPRIGRQIGS